MSEMTINELNIEAKPENMDAVQSFICERIAECSQKTVNQIQIAVDEVFSNISYYAYGSGGGNVTIRIKVGDNILIEFEDEGVAYNPLSSEEPDITAPLEDRKVGGLGVFLLKKLIDNVDYRREENKNILTLTKNL